MLRPHQSLSAVLLVLGLTAAAPACASYGGVYTVSQRDRGQFERRAYDNGFRDGLRQGANDARRGRVFAYERYPEYRSATRGYGRRDSDRDFYQRAFRQGFQAGYTDGYNRARRGRR